MSWWVLAPVFAVGVIACPLRMWAIGKMTKGKVDCMACFGMATGREKESTLSSLEMQKHDVERQIAEVKAGRA